MIALHADRRWCLTGTPIHNRLEDLLSLLRFLQIQPFDGATPRAIFEEHIIRPLFRDEDDPCQNLRNLLKSICLRRTQSNQGQLSASYQTMELKPSVEEKIIYDNVLEQARADIDVLVSTSETFQKYSKLFTLIMKLRMACNYGKWYQTPRTRTHSPSRSPIATPIVDSVLECSLCQGTEVYDLIKENEICPGCSRWLGAANDELGLEDLQPRAKRLRLSPRPYTSENLEATLGDLPYPIKLAAVVDNLVEHEQEGKRYAAELFTLAVAYQANDNSIVFSCWTKTLELLSNMLHQKGLAFERIEGSVSQQERLNRLRTFRESSHVRVLLMTFGTGGVGFVHSHLYRLKKCR